MSKVELSYNGKKYTENKSIFNRAYNIKNFLEAFEESDSEETIQVDLNNSFQFFIKSPKEEQITNTSVDGNEILEAMLEYLRYTDNAGLPLYYGENGDKVHESTDDFKMDGGSASIYLKEPKDITQDEKIFVNSKSMYFIWKLSVAADVFGIFELQDVAGARLSKCFRHHLTEDNDDEILNYFNNNEQHYKFMHFLNENQETI